MTAVPEFLSEILVPLNFFDENYEIRQRRVENLLCKYLNTGTVVAIIGAGASQPLGYPGWGEFAWDVITILKICFAGDDDVLKDVEIRKAQECKKWDLYDFVINTLYTDKFAEEVSKAKKNYEKNQTIDNKSFGDYLEYLDHDYGSELNVLFIFSECERLLCDKMKWEENKQSPIFRQIISSYFDRLQDGANSIEKSEINNSDSNPYIALLALPIKKFITFNYDLEIERAILHEGKIKHQLRKDVYHPQINNHEILEQFDRKSFSQRKEESTNLARFSVARYDETDYSVFHCHGRIDHVESCIVSEEDYQKWYLRENYKQFTPFRQTLSLALESNPILFMGFGLKDADLMRLLRQITANHPANQSRMPLFCLLYVDINDIKAKAVNKCLHQYKWNSEQEFKDECTALYMKYGLHVIPVFAKPNSAKDPMCNKLLDLRNRWKVWWQGILLKPKFRQSPMEYPGSPTNLYFHYKFDLTGRIEKVDERLTDQLQYLLEDRPWSTRSKKIGGQRLSDSPIKRLLHFKSGTDAGKSTASDVAFANRLVVVIGEGGTGKSWAVQQFLKSYESEGFKVFFWSAYYSSDVITGIDRLIEFFKPVETDERTGVRKNKFDLLKAIVDDTEEKKVIVFDGIEKLLIPNNENTEGASVSPEVLEFFKTISHYKNTQSRIVLTSRIFPTDILYHFDSRIDREEKGDTIKLLEDKKFKVRSENVVKAPKCREEDLISAAKSNAFPVLQKGRISSICSLVEGHVFGISLIRGILKNFEDKKVIDPAFDFDREVESLIQQIAGIPMDRRMQGVIEKSIGNVQEKYPGDEKLVENFVERIALFMHPIRTEIAEICFEGLGAQPSVLPRLLDDLVEQSIIQKVTIDTRRKNKTEYVVHQLIRTYVFERLHECLFVSQPSLQLPGFSSGKETVDPGNVRGTDSARNLFNNLCEKASAGPKKTALEIEVASDMCRAAFSILRSRFCSNTVARWGSYDDYLKLTVRLYDTAKKVSPEHWDYKEPSQEGFKRYCESQTLAPLYPDELAWVYNEIGLVSNSMGNIFNSTALWEQGHEINKLIDRHDEEGRYVFQSHFNLGAVNLYYGKLRVAQTHLDKAFEIANKLKNKNLSNRVLGSRALLKYLQGNLEEADNDYTSACNELENNPRARAFIYSLHGELLIKRNDLDKAEKLLEQSRHLAEAKYYPDLIAYSRLGKANLLLQKGAYSDSQHEFQFALGTAKKRCLFRLEAATLSGLSRLAEKLGDYQSARVRAIESLRISNEYSLGLHQTVSLLVLGKALINSELREFGIAYLETSRDLAKSQGYFLRLNEAEQELRKHNVPQ